jgi:hypothetical protein
MQPCAQMDNKNLLHKLNKTHKHYLDGWTEHLVVSFVERPTNAQGSSKFFINTFQILPRHVSAYGCHPQGVVSALYATGAVFCVIGCADCDLSRVASCCGMCPNVYTWTHFSTTGPYHRTPLG